MSEKNNSSNQKEGGFWTTLPGILTASGTLIVAITGLIAILHRVGIICVTGTGSPSNLVPSPSISESNTNGTGTIPGISPSNPVPSPSKPESNTTNIPFGFVIGGAAPTPDKLAKLVKDQIGQFPNMKICESNIGEGDPFYLVIESVGSDPEANELKKRIKENGNFRPDIYTMYRNEILPKKFKFKECKGVNDY
jgi:hypothetical protein